MLILARGGVYPAGNPFETFDFQETYLRHLRIHRLHGHSNRLHPGHDAGPEQVEAATRAAIAEARGAAEEFAGAMAMQVYNRMRSGP